MVLARMRSGFALMGETQFWPGYCLLLAAPGVVHLTDLPLEQRSIYLEDMSVLGEAIIAVCQPRVVNYEILGNSMPLLHTHLFPRYEWEDERLKYAPVWDYAQLYGNLNEYEYSEAVHGELKQLLSETLLDLMEQYEITPLRSQSPAAPVSQPLFYPISQPLAAPVSQPLERPVEVQLLAAPVSQSLEQPEKVQALTAPEEAQILPIPDEAEKAPAGGSE
jgi:diadenosine tetraphosphate (Ap4A) HIT family hydrolase